ncbi:MAG: hypothetical protein ABH857_04370 [Elusimicrobiota bacterium]
MNKILFNKNFNNQGEALPLITFIILIVVVLGAAITLMVREEVKESTMLRGGNEALYIAEGGAHKAISKITSSSEEFTGEGDVPLGKGMYTVTVTNQGNDLYEIISTGYIPNSSNPKHARRLRILFALASDDPSRGFVQDEAFNYAAVGNDNLYINNMSIINSANPGNQGNIRSNANITCENGAIVNGNAYAVGSINLIGASVINGTQNIGQAVLALPEIDLDYYSQKAKEGGVLEGNQTYSSGITNLGPVYINGDLVIENTAIVNLTGDIYVKGNISLHNTSYVKGGYVICAEGTILAKNLAYVGQGDNITAIITSNNTSQAIVLQNASVTSKAIYYAPKGSLKVRNAAIINGCLVAKNLEISNGAIVNHMIDINLDLPGANAIGGENRVVSWREISIE